MTPCLLLLYVISLVLLSLSLSPNVWVGAQSEGSATPGTEDTLPSRLLEAVIAMDSGAIRGAVEGGESIDIVNVNGWSAAMFCVFNGDLMSLNLVIELGINLNAANYDGITPLMMAASQSDKEMVDVLLSGNASPLVKTEDGATAYSMAMDSGRKLVALMIAEAAVLHAIGLEDIDSQLEYLRHGAYVNIRNVAGFTPLISATSVGNARAVQELLGLGADPNRVENDGWAPLHFAAVSGMEEIAETLLAAEAHAGIATNDGRTARSIAEVAGHAALVDLIPDVLEMEEL